MFGWGRNKSDGQPASPAIRGSGGSNARSAAQPGSHGVPLELVRYDTDSGKFHVGEQALKALQGTRDPVGVVAVCGRARQGKSFILNQLLGQSTGFQVAPTVRPCTKGLWMWSAPIRRRNADGSQYQLVLLDSEGIDAWDQTAQYSTQIFSLAVLLSSLFVYNQMGGIDEGALDKLSLVTEMTKHIRVRSENSSEADLSSFTPAFLWLLRDFYLSLEEEGQAVTARQYLETALRPVPGSNASAKAKNQIRDAIKSLFPDRDCFPLVRPMSDEKMLAKLETIDSSQFRPEFQEGVSELTQLIFQKAKPKRMNNSIITGPMLAALTTAYVDAINKGAVPTIATAWQGVAEAESRRAADAAEAAYQNAFNKDVPADEAALDREFDRAFNVGQAAFREVAVGETSIQQANQKRFEDRVQQLFKQFKEQCLTQAALQCEQLINKASTQLTQVSRQADASPESLQAEYNKFEQAYIRGTTGTGALRYQRLNEFRNGAYAALLQDVQQRVNQVKQQELAAERQKAQQAQQQILQAKSEAANLTQQVQQLRSDVDRLRQDLTKERSSNEQQTSRVSSLEKQLQDKASSLVTAQQELQQAVQRERQKGASEQQAAVNQLNLQLQQATQQLADARKDSHTAQLDVESLNKQLRSASSDSSEWITKYQKAEDGRQAATQQLEGLRAELSQAQRQASQAEQRASQAEQRVSEAESRLSQAQQQASEAQAKLASKKQHWEQQLQEAQAQAGGAVPSTAPASEDMAVDHGTKADFDPAKLTIPALRKWLDDNNHQEKAWELGNKRAKKPEYVQCVRELM